MHNRYEIIYTEVLSSARIDHEYLAHRVAEHRRQNRGIEGVEVRTFQRAVKAGGAVIPVTVIVVRRDKRKLLEAVGNGAEAARMDA